MCSGVKKAFSAVARLLKKIWNVIRKYLVYIIMIVAIFWPFLMPMLLTYLPAGLAAIIPTTGAWAVGALSLQSLAIRVAVGLAISFFIDSETTREVVDKMKDVAGDVVEAVGDIAAGVAGGALDAIMKNPVLLGTAAALFWWFFIRDEDGDPVYVGPGAGSESKSPYSGSAPNGDAKINSTDYYDKESIRYV